MPTYRILSFLAFIALAAVTGTTVWVWYQQGRTDSSLQPITEESTQKKEIITPPPLRIPFVEQEAKLTKAGVLNETNRHRASAKLQPLRGNATLDKAAQQKLDDLFKQQYFDHVSPNGTKPADLVDGVGYQYIKVGENLALGNFKDDTVLVQAWMDSPGHRANIMHAQFQELGIAVGQGSFEGHKTWIGVQTFAMPASACPTPDSRLEKEYKEQEARLEVLGSELKNLQSQLKQEQENLEKIAREIESINKEGRAKLEAGNTQIQHGNEVFQETGDRDQAQPYWTEGESLQKQSEELFARAEEKRLAHNARVESIRLKNEMYNKKVVEVKNLEAAIKTTVDKLNAQLALYNQCIK